MLNDFAKYCGEHRCPRCNWLAMYYGHELHFWIKTAPDVAAGTPICTNEACKNFAGKFERAADLPKMEYKAAESRYNISF